MTIKQHTPPERLPLRRKNRKQGPSAQRRKARRAAQLLEKGKVKDQ